MTRRAGSFGAGLDGELAGGPEGLGGDAEEDLDVLFGEGTAGEDATEAQHHVVGGFVGHEADAEEGAAPLVKHGLAHGGRTFGGGLGGEFEGAGGDEQLVGADHDGHGQVQGLVVGGGRDADDLGAKGEVVEGEAVVLGAEHDGDGGGRGGGEEVGRPFAGRLGVVAVESAAVGGAGDEGAVGDGFGEGVEHLAVVEDASGVAGHGGGILHVHALARVDEGQLREAHVHHGAADGADVAAVDGVDEDDADVVEGSHGGGSIREEAGE